jgi:NAD-dependent SIR2 family protein deacetylase
MESDLERRIKTLTQWMFEAKYLVVFTGAGISTESGLPDFRGPDGLWTRRDKGLPPKPRLSWDSAQPNKGHLAIAELQKLGKLKFLISQNIDNLHLKSGIKTELLAELHGNISRLRCESCETTTDESSNLERCPHCGAKLVSSVVNFGQPLPRKDLELSYHHSQKSDLFLVVGSSLVVTPAAYIPREALRAGAKLVIINEGETPFDSVCHLRFNEKIGNVLPQAVNELKKLMSTT